MGRPRSIVHVVVAAALVVGLTIGHGLGLYLPAFNTPHTALENVAHPASAVPPTPGLTRRLAVMMIDGLDYDGARALTALAALRRDGVLRPMRAAFPTYTSPGVTSMVTGLSPRESGIRLNGALTAGPRDLDRVPIAALEAGVAVDIWARAWRPFVALVAPPEGASIHLGRVDFLASVTALLLPGAARPPPIDGQSPARALTLVYVGEVDEAAHQHGTGSPEYRDAVAAAGVLVDRFAATLDFDQDTLIVLSDHGHRPEGGHGGVEPGPERAFLLARGPLLRQGVELDARPLRDVATTLSVLAGVRAPTSNLGRPMLDLFALGDRETSVLLAAPFDQAARLLCRLSVATEAGRCAMVAPLVDRLRHADPTAWPEAEALHDALTDARDRAVAAASDDASRGRLAIAAAGLAIVAIASWLVARRRARWWAGLADPASWVLPPLHLAAYASSLATLGYRVTFSSMKPGPSYFVAASVAGVVAIVAVSLAATALRPRARAPWILIVALTLPFVALAAHVGWDPVVLPPPTAGILVFELGPAVVSAAVAAVVVALVGARRRRSDAGVALPDETRRTG